jgi:hypothetical protein
MRVSPKAFFLENALKLKPKNWEKFQHYKDRCPPWIKLHRDLLNDREFMGLPIASKALAPLLWLLASESKDGSFDAAIEELSFRLHTASKDIEAGLKPLIDKGFFVDASTMLAPRLQVAIPERETERETEREPKKQSRGTRLPADWSPSEEQVQFCKTERPELNPTAVASRFKDYWIAQPGTKGVKTDWPATWRNWVRAERAVGSAAKVEAPAGRPSWARKAS